MYDGLLDVTVNGKHYGNLVETSVRCGKSRRGIVGYWIVMKDPRRRRMIGLYARKVRRCTLVVGGVAGDED